MWGTLVVGPLPSQQKGGTSAMGRLTHMEGGDLGAEQARKQEGLRGGGLLLWAQSQQAAASEEPRGAGQGAPAGACTPSSRGRMLPSERENTGAEPLSASSRPLSWLLAAALGVTNPTHCARALSHHPEKGKRAEHLPEGIHDSTATSRG